VTAHNLGLAEAEATIRFSIDQNCMNHVVTDLENHVEALDVAVTSLDHMISEPPFMIKVDVEGYELSVLRGSQRVLRDRALSAVILELNNSGLRYGFKDQEIVDLMNEFGFETYEYEPFERTLTALGGKNKSSGNTLFLRNIDAINERIDNAAKIEIHGLAF